jgi:hypothetical protein
MSRKKLLELRTQFEGLGIVQLDTKDGIRLINAVLEALDEKQNKDVRLGPSPYDASRKHRREPWDRSY